MKIIYTGQLPIKNADLTRVGIFKPSDDIRKGTVFEIPDEKIELIQRVLCGGNYQKYVEPQKKFGKFKKKEKEEKMKEEK